MKTLTVRTPRHLDICLRLLFIENTDFTLKVVKTDKGKIVYEINIIADEQEFELLKEKYDGLTSQDNLLVQKIVETQSSSFHLSMLYYILKGGALMMVHVVDMEKLAKDSSYKGHYEERDYSATENRHHPLCVVCGMKVYPECREWCPNEKTARGEDWNK